MVEQPKVLSESGMMAHIRGKVEVNDGSLTAYGGLGPNEARFLLSQYDTLRSQVATLTHDLANEREKVERLRISRQEEMDRYINECNHADTLVREHKAEVESLRAEVERLRSEVSRLEENNRLWKAQNDENAQAYSDGCEVNRRQWESLQRAKAERDRYKAAYDLLNASAKDVAGEAGIYWLDAQLRLCEGLNMAEEILKPAEAVQS